MVLKEIYDTYGHLTVFKYAQKWEIAPKIFYPLREKFLKEAHKYAEEIYGSAKAEKIIFQLKNEALVSTIDHHGIFNHPFFLNSNLIFSLRHKEYLICLPIEGVSLNNNTSWSGCLLKTETSGHLARFSIFPDKMKTSSVIGLKPFGKNNVTKLSDNIGKDKFLSWAEKKHLLDFVQKSLLSHEVLKQPSFSRQASLVSTAIWNELFAGAGELIYLPLETLITRILLDELEDPKSVLSFLIASKEGWREAEKYFFGLKGFIGKDFGSFLFWGLAESGRRFALKKSGGILENGEFKILPQQIARALKEGKIYPGSLICFLVLLLSGINSLGGFNQVNWLTEIKKMFLLFLNERGLTQESLAVAKVPTKNFAESPVMLLNQGSYTYKPTAIDLMLSGKKDSYESFLKKAGEISLKESIDSELEEIYKVVIKNPQNH